MHTFEKKNLGIRILALHTYTHTHMFKNIFTILITQSHSSHSSLSHSLSLSRSLHVFYCWSIKIIKLSCKRKKKIWHVRIWNQSVMKTFYLSIIHIMIMYLVLIHIYFSFHGMQKWRKYIFLILISHFFNIFFSLILTLKALWKLLCKVFFFSFGLL